MERFIKWKHTIYSKEYDDLLKKEIETWGVAWTSTMTYDEVKKSVPYRTYRNGIIDEEIHCIASLEKKNIRVLELWWSNGWLSEEIAKVDNVSEITCIDISLSESRKEQTIHNKKYILVKGDLNKIEEIQFDTDGYDVIITHGTLHHLVDPKRVLEFSVNTLLKKEWILMINDSYILSSLQLKTNALIVLIFIKVPKFIVELKFIDFLASIIKIPMVLFHKNSAASIAHNHAASPFESISSYEDYASVYTMRNIKLLTFRRFAAIPAIFWAIDHYPFKNTQIIQKLIKQLWRLDAYLIQKNIFSWDAHLTIFQKHE